MINLFCTVFFSGFSVSKCKCEETYKIMSPSKGHTVNIKHQKNKKNNIL